MSNSLAFILNNFLWLLAAGLVGLFLGWLFFRGKKIDGDLSVEGEGALRAEADNLRARVQELEGNVSSRDTEISGLKGKLAAGAAGAAAATALAATTVGSKADDGDTDDTYALEWRNRYLAARVKYLESQLAEAPKAPAEKVASKKKKATAAKAAGAASLAGAAVAAKPKTKAKPKAKAAPKPKAKPKAKAAAKPKSKAAPKPKVLYTDGPTDGAPDDLKLIKGIGPKFEKDLNSKGIYYFRQIAAWKKKDVTMVEGVIDSIPGRIERDSWVPQAKGLAKSAAAESKTRKKPGPKPGTKRGKLTAAGKPRQKPGPKAGSKRGKAKPSEADAAFEKYFTNVQKYHPKARKPVVQGIVKHCGIALRTRDGSLVACSDEAELQTVADGFVTKKLGKTEGQMDLVKDVCQEMKGERFKSRVTFYYLAAKKARKLGQFT
jgi:predicted flap endonuclease-1-like 5' DNA nuclease